MRGRVGPEASHGPHVQVEVAGEPALAVLVALLGQDDLVDEAGGWRGPRRQPGDVVAAEALLQRLEQGHEVPDGEDVMLHEQPEGRRAVELPVDRVALTAPPAAAPASVRSRSIRIAPIACPTPPFIPLVYGCGRRRASGSDARHNYS